MARARLLKRKQERLPDVLAKIPGERSGHRLGDARQCPERGVEQVEGRAENILVSVAGDADREVLDDLSSGGRADAVARIPAVKVMKASARIGFPPRVNGLIQPN